MISIVYVRLRGKQYHSALGLSSTFNQTNWQINVNFRAYLNTLQHLDCNQNPGTICSVELNNYADWMGIFWGQKADLATTISAQRTVNGILILTRLTKLVPNLETGIVNIDEIVKSWIYKPRTSIFVLFSSISMLMDS